MALPELKADCSQCFGLCCVVTAFGKSEDFAFDRGPGTPCPNLQSDDRCGIHDRLPVSGMAGCTKFDCFGAGQQLSQVTFKGRSWRDSNAVKTQMILALSVMRPLHEMLWYLVDALSFTSGLLADRMVANVDHIEALTRGEPASLFAMGADAERKKVDVLLQEASAIVRAPFESWQRFENADVSGQSFEDADLAGVDFSHATLTLTEFRGADLSRCDFLGAKFSNTDIRSANLESAIYLTQMQVNGCVGNVETLLPERIDRPGHWL